MLDLDLTEISDDRIKHLENLSNLKELRLKDNPQLTDGCVVHLLKIKTLSLIHLGNTSLTIEGVKKIILGMNLHTIILDDIFKNMQEELIKLSLDAQDTEIFIKGHAMICNGQLVK